ncbi:MAG: HAMP domain-containing histidine kinase [Lachnospiraceae bacterium]|nr:HAMP domain-containing histidine kinase [Lachnospiraceae bacterium]
MKLRFKVSLITAAALFIGSAVSGAAVIYQSAYYNREKTVESYEQQTTAAARVVGKELEYELMAHFTDATLASYYDYVLQKYAPAHYILVEGGEVVCNRTSYELADPTDIRWSERSVIQKSEDRYLLLVGRAVPAAGAKEYTLIGIQDITPVYEDIYRQSLLCAGICAGVSLLAALLAFAAVRRSLSPLRELQRAARDISGGRLERRADVRTRDEIGMLAVSFNEMAERIEEQVETLSQESERRRQMLGSLTHELKTPMTSIMGYADSLLHVNLREEQKERALRHIHEECGRISRLGSKLMSLLGMYDNDSICMEEVSVEAVLNSVARAEEAHLREKGMTLRCFCEMGTRRMDRDLFESLLINLIDNGIKASPDGGVIALTAAGEQITVQDWGCGIPAQEISKVTEAFYMVDKARNRREGGSGLGLALCEKIAQLHGAELKIESTVGEGTTVRIVFYKTFTV